MLQLICAVGYVMVCVYLCVEIVFDLSQFKCS